MRCSERQVAPLAARLNRRWRQVAAAFSFALFGVGALLLALGLLLPLRLLVRTPARRQRLVRAVIRRALRFFWGTMHALGLLHYRIDGVEHLAAPGALIVANHPTLIDAVLLLGLIDDAAVVAKQALARHPLTRPFIALAGYIGNDDGPAMVHAAAREFARGARVLIFPESSRTLPGARVRLTRGAAQIAARTGCPIVVVTIRVSEPLLYKGAAWHAMPMSRPRFDVKVRAPWEVASVVAAHGSVALAARDIHARLQQLYDTEMADHGAA
ncbi:MAG: 1-acyl-sn-glycerol-3-phosphate acyltransferase [Burkholderiaceae bacterium]|nr:1-acyl-sn-glycerol-3-phosphate acyltransferase [Burkholderiaceae bacterium]